MYLCGYVACSARAPAQHCWMCCASERNIVGPRFDDHETIEMLALAGSEVSPVSNFIQKLPTSRNNTQQHTTWCANARNMLGPTMLREFARAFTVTITDSVGNIRPFTKTKTFSSELSSSLWFLRRFKVIPRRSRFELKDHANKSQPTLGGFYRKWPQ